MTAEFRLHDDQLEALIEGVAERLANALATPRQSNDQLVDTATLAAMLSVEPSWVRVHAAELGAIRLGEKGARLRFDPERARQALNVPAPAKPPPPRRKRRPATGSVLRVRG